MAKLSKEQLFLELSAKKLLLDKDSPSYKNINSPIRVICEKGHIIETNLKTIRSNIFRCPICEGESSRNFDAASVKNLPPKKGYRVLGIDNATQRFGVSIFENGKLIYYNVLIFSGNTINRLSQIRDMLENIIIPIWEPDFIQFEDIQLQGQAFNTYEVLVKLIGIIEIACERFGVPYEKTRSNIWRSSFLINGRKREEEKEKAIKLVKSMYNITVSDDIAEAILIGRFRVNLIEKENRKDLF